MKKALSIFTFAAAALLMASCSSDEVINSNQRSSDQIRFDVMAGRMTRAQDVYSNVNLPDSFNVWATYFTESLSDGTVYMDGDQIVNESGTWTDRSGDRYWPVTGQIRFFGYVNDQGSFTYDQGAPKFQNFTVDTVAAKQLDLLYAIQTSARTTQPVTMNFRHALSQVVFQAKNSNPNLHVTIYGVTVVNVNKSGTYAFNLTDSNTENEIVSADGTYETTGRGTWTLGSTLASYPVSFTGVPLDTVNTTYNLTNTTPAEKKWGNALLLLPQPTATTEWDLKLASKGTQTYFLVNYSAYNEAAGERTYIWGSATAGRNAAVPASFLWKEGCKYIYTFTFGQGNGGVDPDNPNAPCSCRSRSTSPSTTSSTPTMS